jgi:hypothetical protein
MPMKRAWDFVVLALAVCMVTVSVLAVAKMFSIFSDGKSLWDIASAIGTIGATIAAIWIATRDGRRLSKESLDNAIVTAAAITWRMTFASLEIEPLVRRFQLASSFDLNPETFRHAREKLDLVDIGGMDEVRAMIPLPGHCASKLAAAQDRLRGLRTLLHKIEGSSEVIANRQERIRQARQIGDFLHELSELIEFVRNESEMASHRSISSGWPFNA